jgi:hypothetical protein
MVRYRGKLSGFELDVQAQTRRSIAARTGTVGPTQNSGLELIGDQSALIEERAWSSACMHCFAPVWRTKVARFRTHYFRSFSLHT